MVLKRVTQVGMFALVFGIAVSSQARQSTKEATQNAALTPAEKEFILKASDAGLAEVQLAELVYSRASNAEVKQFATQMKQDHTQANQELAVKAKAYGVTTPTVLSERFQQIKAKLEGLKGPQFDAQYVQTQVTMHEEAVVLFRSESTSGKANDIREWATQKLPVLEQHLQHIKQVAATVNTSTKS